MCYGNEHVPLDSIFLPWKKLFQRLSNHPIIICTHTHIQMMREIEVDVPQTAAVFVRAAECSK